MPLTEFFTFKSPPSKYADGLFSKTNNMISVLVSFSTDSSVTFQWPHFPCQLSTHYSGFHCPALNKMCNGQCLCTKPLSLQCRPPLCWNHLKGGAWKSIGLCCLLIVSWPELKKHVVTFPNNKCMTSDHIIAWIKSWFQFLHLYISHWLFSHRHASEPFLSTGNLLFCPCFSCLPCVANVVYSSGSHLLWWWL